MPQSQLSTERSNVKWFINTIEIGDVKLPELQNKVQGIRYKKQKCTMGIRSGSQTKSLSYIFNQSYGGSVKLSKGNC
jgi:hypothetical protein